ncbi:site-specific integrase [Roseateles sp. PN1]|uniref:site-specific integrase n=1 Tax=Roseateles sp. PN1 TaxID=3137372 RepID=UPI0031397389
MSSGSYAVSGATQLLNFGSFTSGNTQFSLPIRVDALGRVEVAEVAVQSIARNEDDQAVMRYVEAATANATRKAYQGDLRDFLAWGGLIPSTPEVLAAYVAARSQLHAPATILRRMIGIGRAHTSLGFPDPAKADLVRTVLRGCRRLHGKPQRQAAPLLRQDLFPILEQMSGMRGLRDRALLLLGFAAALRRSELVGLDVEHLEFVPEGLLVHLLRSKTDQSGCGRKIAVPFGRTAACPVKAVSNWMAAAGIGCGPLFRSVSKAGAVSARRLSDQSVALIVKRNVNVIGLPKVAYSGHSLRSGLVTCAAQLGVGLMKIQEQTGHRSLNMLSRYVRDANVFENNAAGCVL